MPDPRASANIDSTNENVVQLSEHAARLLIDLSPAVHYIASACNDFGATYISRGVREQLGFEPNQFTEDSAFWINHVHPSDRARTMANLSEIFDAGRLKMEYRFQRSDGSWRWMHDESVLIRDEDGEPLKIAGVWFDITEQKEAEISLARQKAFSESLIETAPTIILLLDSDGRILDINPYMEHLSGYGAEEVVGKDWFSTFLPKKEQPEIRELFDAVVSAGANPGHTNPIVTKDGSLRQVEWQSKILEDEDGRRIALLNVGHDVTERTEYERALQEARQDAEAANASKSRFLAAAGHDLRQPLYAMSLFLGALIDQLDSRDLLKICEKMEAAIDSMTELLDALLSVSKLESGSVVPRIQDFPIQTLLDRIILTNQQQADEKGLQLHCAADGSVVRSDLVLLERIVNNLVANAIQYTDRGSVSISCYRSGEVARIEVSDSGVGIPHQDLDRIFEEYYQIDNPSRDRRKGLGLGLSIVKHISRLLGHWLDVTSKPGEGSTFSVEIPLGTNRTDQPELPKCVKTPNHKRLGGQILLIEDDPAVAEATTMLLESHGVNVCSAAHVDEALAQLEEGVRPNVVISDYRLPGDSGIEVIRRIRSVVGEDIPAVLVTGDTSLEERQSMTLPDCRILFKPVDTIRLIEAIEHLISQSY
jgi:PAS domain S-box-containing protein